MVGPEAIDGVLVERMASVGQEIIVGAIHDSTFGPVVMVGSGGANAEIFADSFFLPLPIDHTEAALAIGNLRCAPALNGAYGHPKADVTALADLLVRVAAIAQYGDIEELDLNPVLVHGTGRGVTVLDAWVVLRGGE